MKRLPASSVAEAAQGRGTLAGIVALYAVFAAAWIFFSDRVLEYFTDPATITRLSTVKGLAFVVVTSSLLYLLLNGWHLSRDGAGWADEAPGRPTTRRWLLVGALALIVPLVGLIIVKQQGPQTERDAYANLQAIARLKAEQIENWLAERRGDGLSLANSHGFVRQVAKLRGGNDREQKALLSAQLDVMRQSYGYASILLLDEQGWPMLSLGEQSPFATSTGLLLPTALASGEVMRTELLLDRDGLVYLDFVVPLLLAEDGGRRPVGAVVLRVHPERFLFPLIQSWPTASASAETLLVRREGDSVVFLNELRHRRNTALTLSFPLAPARLPAVLAARSVQPGTMAGKDYREVDVLAAYRPVAGTDWMLVAKADRDEIMAPLWSLVFWVCLVAFAALVVIGVLMQLLWRQQLVAQREAALREGELRYRAVTESSGDAIVSANGAGHIVNWNPAAERLFGYSTAEAVGQPLTLLMPQRFHEQHEAGMQRVVNGGMARAIGKTLELAGRHKSGSEFPLELSLTTWDSKHERFFIGTMRDITERRANEAKLQRLTRIYAALSECNQSIVRCSNEATLFAQICRDAVQFGGAKMAWIGMIDAAVRQVRPVCSFGEGGEEYLHDIEASTDMDNPFVHGPVGCAVRESRPVWVRDFMTDPDTQPWHEAARRFGWGAFAALPLHRNNEVVGVFCLYASEIDAFDDAIRNLLGEMAMDISFALDNFDAQEKRAQAEENTRRLLAENETILRNALVGIVHLKVGRVVACNRRFEEIFAYAPGALAGASAEVFFESPALCADVHQRAFQTLSEGRSYSEEVMFRRNDGSLFWGALTGCAIDPARPEDGSIWIYADISERVRLEEQLHNHQVHLEVLVQQRTADLENALAAARLADLAKDAFLANVSHELRTPLNAVIGMADLARRLSHDPAQQAYLDKIGSAGQTLAHLIDDLLDLSKIVAGRMEFENTTFSLRRMIQRGSSVMSYKAADKGLQLVERIADDVPDTLVGDPLRIEQILLNLISNAIKFTNAGQIEVRVGVHAREAERICLTLEIADSGVGMSETEMAQLFKPFSQADVSMTRKYGGTGLGLAICKRLAEMMDGEIGVSSQPGRGSTFRVTLWLGLGKAEDLPAGELAGGEDLPQRYRGARILVVEDQALNREIVEALLKLVGITPRMAGDGRQALDILDASGPAAFDLVLMDIQMPVMDGLAVTRELRSRPGFASLPIIAMTAHTMEHEKEISIQAGMNDHIGKPFDRASFYRTLARWLPKARRQPEGAVPCEAGAEDAAPASDFPALDGIDSAAGIARFGGNESRYRHWLRVFVDEAPATVLHIRQALAVERGEEARQAVHAFKGRVGMLGMNELHSAASALEAALKQGQPVEGWLGKLERGVDRMRHEIERAPGLPLAVPAPLLQAPGGLPSGPPPDAVAQLLDKLAASDGGSASAIAHCLEALGDSDWAPRLQLALAHAQDFDFAAAANALSAAKLPQAAAVAAPGENSGS